MTITKKLGLQIKWELRINHVQINRVRPVIFFETYTYGRVQ